MFGFWRKKLTYKCYCCGETYTGSPSMAYMKPPYYFGVPEDERADRITIDSDMCHIRADPNDPEDADVYAIRGTLDIPIRGTSEPFCWGLWVSQSQESFERYKATFNQDQSEFGSFAWLAVDIPYYRRTADGERVESLPCDLRWGAKGQRPKIVVQKCDHPLYRDQQRGISWDKAVEIAQETMKGTH